MDTNNLIPLLGKESSNPEVQKILTSGDQKVKLKLPAGDFQTYAEFKNLGLSLVFEDSQYFGKKTNTKQPKNALIFIGFFAYSEGEEGFSLFEGALPDGLSFDHSRQVLVREFGEPVFRFPPSGEVEEERWDRKGYRVMVKYGKDPETLLMVYCGIR